MQQNTPSEMLATVTNSDIALWSEDKRKDFVSLFKLRASTARYVLYAASHMVRQTASERHFIGEREAAKLAETLGHEYKNIQRAPGDRTVDELTEIAKERAAHVIALLPTTQAAVQVLKPEIAATMKRRDELAAQVDKLGEELMELPCEIRMKELPQDMTIGAFLKYVDEVETKKETLLKKIAKLAEEGTGLNRQIDKALYGGIPELSNAVVTAVLNMKAQADALGVTTRRVEEFVQFGDVQQMVDVFKRFEQDEKDIDKATTLALSETLQKLNLQKGKKAAAPKAKSKKKK